MLVDGVAPGDEVDSPQGVHDLIPREHPPGIRRQQVEQALLQGGEVQVRRAGSDLAVENVDLDLSQFDHWIEGRAAAVRSARDCEHAGGSDAETKT